MKEYVKLVGLAKSSVDNGFSRVGKSMNGSSNAERALMLGAARAVAIANGIVVLAQHELANEALPLLRSLFEIACAMRWLIKEDREVRGREVLKEWETAGWGTLWHEERLNERMEEFRFSEDVIKSVSRSCFDHLHGNAQGLPWGHSFEENKHAGVSADETLRLAAIAVGHVVKALDVRWPGKFEGAEQLWEKAK